MSAFEQILGKEQLEASDFDSIKALLESVSLNEPITFLSKSSGNIKIGTIGNVYYPNNKGSDKFLDALIFDYYNPFIQIPISFTFIERIDLVEGQYQITLDLR